MYDGLECKLGSNTCDEQPPLKTTSSVYRTRNSVRFSRETVSTMGVGSGAAGAAWAALIICKKKKRGGKEKGGERREYGEGIHV